MSPDRPLSGLAVRLASESRGSRHALCLLSELGAEHSDKPDAIEIGPPASSATDDAWARSGAMWLTGRASHPPLRPQGDPASALEGTLLAMEVLLRWRASEIPPLPGVTLFGERAAAAGYARQGPRSCGGSFELIETADGWVGINLARWSDHELLPALTDGVLNPGARSPWVDLERWLANQPAAAVAERARLLHLPLVVVPDGQGDEQLAARWGQLPPRPFRLSGPFSGSAPRWQRPVVVDLSALWAGPLCAHLIGLAGARVVKVESTHRPDGARRGPREFYDLLHGGHESLALDLRSPHAVSTLRELMLIADLVIDSSRPRAMSQLGIDVQEIVRSGTSWLSITGYGRTGPWRDQPAFGDDAAAAGGLVARDERGPVPAADAIADPLTGVHAALAGLAALSAGGSWLIDLAMRDVALVTASLPAEHGSAGAIVRRPVLRPSPMRAASMGQHTDQLLAEFGLRVGLP